MRAHIVFSNLMECWRQNEYPGPWSDSLCNLSMKPIPCILADKETMLQDRIFWRPRYLMHQKQLQQPERVAQVIYRILPNFRSCRQMLPMTFPGS